MRIQVRFKRTTLCLCVRDIETKSADDTYKVLVHSRYQFNIIYLSYHVVSFFLRALRQLLDDLHTACKTLTASKDVLKNISATMSDRAATEVKFNDLSERHFFQ